MSHDGAAGPEMVSVDGAWFVRGIDGDWRPAARAGGQGVAGMGSRGGVIVVSRSTAPCSISTPASGGRQSRPIRLGRAGRWSPTGTSRSTVF